MTDAFSIRIPTTTADSNKADTPKTTLADNTPTASETATSKDRGPGTDTTIVSTTTTNAAVDSTPTHDVQSLPQYIAPNVNAIIPSSSSLARMRFKYIPYSDLVKDAVLTAQFVQSLPVMLSNSLGITADDVIVVSITSADNNSATSSTTGASDKRKRSFLQKRDANESGIVVSIAIPSDRVDSLQTLINEPASSLYSSSNGQLASLIDSSYPVRSSGKVASKFTLQNEG